MLEFLRTYGDLRRDFTYQGSERSGYSRMPGAGNVTAELRKPLDMRTLVDANFWHGMLFEDELDYQATMFQPVGGMDRIAYAFAKRLGRTIQYKAAVTELRKTENGVRVVYEQGGAKKTLEADYCVCALPASILRSLTN
jgi:monoamine oxidase